MSEVSFVEVNREWAAETTTGPLPHEAVELSRRKGSGRDRTAAFSTQDPRLAELFASVPPRLPDAASSLAG